MVWGALEATKHSWYLLSLCVYVPLLLYQKEGEKKAPFFPFSPFLFVRCRGRSRCKLNSPRIDMARPRTRVTCAS